MAADDPKWLYAQQLSVTVYSQTPRVGAQALNEIARALAAGEAVAAVDLGTAVPVDGASLAALLAASSQNGEEHRHDFDFHTHTDERGFIHRCYHRCRHWLSPGFLAGWLVANTITFPVEHEMWQHVWPYSYVGHWLETSKQLPGYASALWLISFGLMIIAGVRYTITRRASY